MNYTISFYCKKSKHPEIFNKNCETLGFDYYLEFRDQTPIITTNIGGAHEIFKLMCTIEEKCSTVVEHLGYTKGLI